MSAAYTHVQHIQNSFIIQCKDPLEDQHMRRIYRSGLFLSLVLGEGVDRYFSSFARLHLRNMLVWGPASLHTLSSGHVDTRQEYQNLLPRESQNHIHSEKLSWIPLDLKACKMSPDLKFSQ